MVKNAIGIIDLGLEGFNIAKTLAENLKREKIVYVTDLSYDSHLNVTENEIEGIVRRSVEALNEHNPKLIIIASGLIVERAAAAILDLKVPSVNIVETLIDYANTCFEQKNMVLLAKAALLEANLFQRNLKYNRLYQIPSDELDAVVKAGMMKTSRSFNAVLESFQQVLKKPVDLIIAATPNLNLLETEMREYLEFEEVTDAGKIYFRRLKEEKLVDLNARGQGGFFVYSNLPKKDFRKYPAVRNCRFKYKQLAAKEGSGFDGGKD